MKNIFKILSASILLLLSGSALADGWVGGSIAGVRSSNDDGLLNSQLASSGLNAEADTEDKFRITWQLYGGYKFFERWGIELGYLDLDKVKTTFTGVTADIEAFLNSAQDIHPQTAQGWLISIIHYLPLDYTNHVKFRIGMYNWEADYTLQGGSLTKTVSQDGADLSYGIGLEMGGLRRKGVIGHIKWEHYSVNKTDFEVIAFGLSYYY